MERIALGIAYDGSGFHGWQAQRRASAPRTVQQELEAVLSQIADHRVKVHCAGRTDAGVHASAQIVHFDLQQPRPLRAWSRGANSSLPHDIAVRWARPVVEDFHARRSAVSRSYSYLIDNRTVRSPLLGKGMTWIPWRLDVSAMHRAAQVLIGEHDFSAFRGAGCQSVTPFRRVFSVSVRACGDLVRIDIQANAFLLHMVRNIVGSLLEIGQSRQAEPWMVELLDGRDRRLAAATAPPQGLYLVRVGYPLRFGLPDFPNLPGLPF